MQDKPRGTRGHCYVLLHHKQALCLGSPPTRRALLWAVYCLGAHLRRQPRCVTTTPGQRGDPPPTDSHSARPASTTPSLQTAHHQSAPWRIFSPPLLILLSRQVDCNSQASTRVIYACSLYHTIIHSPPVPAITCDSRPAPRQILSGIPCGQSVCFANDSLTPFTALP